VAARRSSSLRQFAHRVGGGIRRNMWLLRNAKDITTIKVLKGLGPANVPAHIRLRLFGHPLVVRCRTTDVWTVWDLLYSAEYSPVAPIRRRTVVDCGANVGMFLVSLLKECAGELQRYVAAEPDEASFELLQRQVKLCGAPPDTGPSYGQLRGPPREWAPRGDTPK
jgi:hypothetical protein